MRWTINITKKPLNGRNWLPLFDFLKLQE